jgi:hypothetical protein
MRLSVIFVVFMVAIFDLSGKEVVKELENLKGCYLPGT